MRRLFALSMTFLTGSVLSWGQIAEWIIPPVYTDMYIAAGTNLIVTDSLSRNRSLWSFTGQRFDSANCDVNAFRDGVAVCTQRGTVEVLGLYNINGEYIPIQKTGHRFWTTYHYPFFSNGYLLVENPVLQGYQFVDTKGRVDERVFAKAYPFLNGFSSCQYASGKENSKELFWGLIDKDMELIEFFINEKAVSAYEIDYISSVNDEGIAVVIIRKKVYLFHTDSGLLTPVCPMENEESEKQQVRIQSDLSQSIISTEGRTYNIQANAGKSNAVSVKLDELAKPVSIQFVDSEKEFKINERAVKPLTSLFQPTEVGKKYGINWVGTEILPPQFDTQPFCFDDCAIVQLAGKYGLLKLNKDDRFQISVYKGKDVPFKHQTFETTLRLDLPKYVPAEKATLEINPASGCEIDKTSEESKNTQYGNYVQYDCTLHIPSNLPDDEPIEIHYPSTVYYSGLMSTTVPIVVKAWHYKYFVVDIIDSETVMDMGTLNFTFNINAQRDLGEPIYHTIVNVQADSLAFSLEKLSETRYKCRIPKLREGLNSIVVQVIEQGCPAVPFPFEITYVKPVAEAKGQPAVEEKVEIKKKEKKPVKVKKNPYVEM